MVNDFISAWGNHPLSHDEYAAVATRLADLVVAESDPAALESELNALVGLASWGLAPPDAMGRALSRPRADLDLAAQEQYDELVRLCEEQAHPMFPHLGDLMASFDPELERTYDPVELVRYGLSASDYWVDHALRWLDQGVPVASLMPELKALESGREHPRSLRHRAWRLRRSGA